MKIAVIPGDGIGPEVTGQAVNVLKAASKKYKFDVEFEEVLMGGIAIDKKGNPLPEETVNTCLASDAVLLGAVGGEKWDNLPGNKRPEAGLMGIRKTMEVYANLRPAILFPQLKDSSALKPEILADGLNVMVVRELTGGIYFGARGKETLENGEERAFDTMSYTTHEIKRLAKVGFESAMKRNKKVTLVDKSNILESSRLWRKIVTEMAKDYPEVEINFLYVDNASMQLVRNPKQFDVIITENMFGDILSDEASMLTGSLGMLPSASIGSTKRGLYEPIHGSAPDIAGQNKANPIATIMSVAMMLRYSFDMEDAAADIEKAVSSVLDAGYRTGDIMQPGMKLVGTKEMGELIAKAV